MVVKHTPRHEVIDARVWDVSMSRWWSLAPWEEISLQWREDWGVDTGEIRLAEDHPMASRLRSARHVPVPVTFEVNGVRWDGYVESTETGQEPDGTRYLRVTVQSETKHFHRMLGRGPVASAADGSSGIEEGYLGDVTHRLVARGAVRTGLPTYVLIDHQGDPVQIEVRTEDYVASLLEEPLAGSDSFVQVRKLLPGEPIPGTGRALHYEGAMERQWENAQLAKGVWPNAATNPRIYGSNVLPDAPPMPDNSWSGRGQVKDGALLSEPTEGICWIPFETVVERPLGYYAEVDPAKVHVIERTKIKDGPGATAGRPHFVTYWEEGKFASTPALAEAAKAGLVRTAGGKRLGTAEQVVAHIGGGRAYAWKEGVEWVIATPPEFLEDNKRYAATGSAQRQTPGVLVWQHAGRDRRGVVFSSAPGGGLKRWATTETAPDGAMLVGGGQLDAQTIAALESGALKPKGTVAAADSASAKALLPASSSMPGSVERLDVDVQPHATIDGTEVSFSKAGGKVNIEAAGPFFLREKYMNLSSTGGTNPTAEIAREWAASQGTTSMSLTPGHHQTVVFGDDVRGEDGRVVPGWKPGDRISFVDGTTRVSEVIMGYTLKASATSALTVEPILGRRDNGVMAQFKSMVEESEKTGRKALLSPPRKVPKEEVKAIADDSASAVNKSLIEVSKDLSERISKTVANADFAEYDAELQASLWGDQGEFNRINTEFQEKQKAIDAAQDEINRLQDERLADQDEALEAIRAQQAAEIEASKKRVNVAFVSDYGCSHPDINFTKLNPGWRAVIPSGSSMLQAEYYDMDDAIMLDDGRAHFLRPTENWFKPPSGENRIHEWNTANKLARFTWVSAPIRAGSSKVDGVSFSPAGSTWVTVDEHTISPESEARQFAAVWTANWRAVNRGSLYRARITTSSGMVLAEWGSSNIGPFTPLGDGRYSMRVSCRDKTIPAGQTVLFQVYSNAGGASQRAISSTSSNATWIEDV